MAEITKKVHREPLVHIAKRVELSGLNAWGIRFAAIGIAFVLVGILSSVLTGSSIAQVYDIMFRGAFGRVFEGKLSLLWRFFQNTAILLGLSLAVTPAFKMRFWNCGAEGQALIGGLVAMVCMMQFGSLPYGVLLVLIVVLSTVAGAIWGVIPAIFKAHYNTNETLFTLMMNYVATQIVAYYVYLTGKGSGIIQPVSTGNLPVIGGQQYLLNILIVAVLTVAMFVYLKYSKQGYEIAVVGESQNTARYIGINVKKIIVRTMAISGAVCGITGMLLVAGTDHSINTNTVGGQGFTAIMVSWLGQFNPYIMAGMSALIVFLESGAGKVADSFFLNGSYADIVSGIVILFLVGCEFFIRYTVKFRHSKKEATV